MQPRRCLILIASSLMLLLAACQPATKPAPPVKPESSTTTGQPQPRLRTLKLWIGPRELTAELCLTPEQIQKGMMFRTDIPENEGMLFIFGQPHRASFWMKNTLIPLSCAYVDREGAILEIHELEPRNETPVVASSDRVQYVLEVRQGWFTRNEIRPGTVIRTERGSLSETFFGGR